MSINSSGSLLASLLYDIANVPGDQEGFLLGSVVKKITDSPNDNDAQLRKEEYVTNIFSYQPCSKVCCFYDACGKINKEKLKNLLDVKHGEIVGWYKARRNSGLSMSFREKMIHRGLLELFPDTVQKTFVFGLFVSSVTSNGSTHSLDKVFSSFGGRKFETIPLTIANLGDTAHTEYQLQASHAYNSRHGYYKAIIDSLSDVAITKKGSFPAVEAVKEMNSSVLAKLEALSREVAESELVLASLNNEVERIRSSIHEKQGFTLEDQHTHKTDEKTKQEEMEFQSLIDFGDDHGSDVGAACTSTIPSSELHEDLLALANPTPLQPEKEIPLEPLIPTLATPASQTSSTNTSTASHGHPAMDLDPFPFLSGIAKTKGEQTASSNATASDTEEMSALAKNIQNKQKTRWKDGNKQVDTQANQNTKSLKLHKSGNSQSTRVHRKPVEQDETVPSRQIVSDSPYF